MSGIVVVVWIALGAASGWAVSRLMLGAEDDALRGTAAGMVGAVLGGLGMQLLDSPSAIGSSSLNASVAALAGSLWATWVTCVVTSGRHRDSDRAALERGATPPVVAPGAAAQPATLTYTAARVYLVDQLLRDAMAHDAGRFDLIGGRFDSVERRLPLGEAPELNRLRVALAFWDGWIDARNHDWQLDGEIAEAEWPLLARTVAADLEGDREVTDARVVMRYDARVYQPPAARRPIFAARGRAN